MKLTLSLGLRCECRLCRRLIPDEETKADNAQDVAMFGYAAYAVCPSCRQPTYALKYDTNFRARVRRFVKRTHCAAA